MLLSLSCEDNRVERRDVKSERMQFRSCERQGRQGEALAEGTCGHRSISGSELKLSASQGHEIPGGSLLHLGIILKFASPFNMNFQSQPLLFFCPVDQLKHTAGCNLSSFYLKCTSCQTLIFTTLPSGEH